MARAKSVFFDPLLVLCGIEFAQAAADPELVENILSAMPYDIVLTSVTRRADGSDFGLHFDMPQTEFNDFAMEYASLLSETIAQTDFDVLSRPLAPLRQVNADLSFFEECMRPVMRELALKNKALELNTRDLLGSEKVRDLYIALLKTYREAGGTDITIGSESFYNEEIGNGMEIAQTAAKMAGFEYISLFDKRTAYHFAI